jgi:hypothetical protein
MLERTTTWWPLIGSVRGCLRPTSPVAYDVFFPRNHPSGFPSMSHRFPQAPFSLTHDLSSSFALAGYPVHLADSQSARFSLGDFTHAQGQYDKDG